MYARMILVPLVGLVIAMLLVACGASDEETKPSKPLKPLKAAVTSAERAGNPHGHPAIEVSGTLPGPGWTAEARTQHANGKITLQVMAIPGKHAKKSKTPVPFSKIFEVPEASAGVPISVLDKRGMEIRRFE